MSDADQRLGELEAEPVTDIRFLAQERALRVLMETYTHHRETGQPMPPTVLDGLRDAFKGTRDHVPEVLRQPLRTIGEIGDWFGESPPPREWLLKRDGNGALGRGVVGMLVGPGGRGKSWLLCQLALSVATGRPWLDTFDVTAPGRVVIALAEEDEQEMRRRLFYAACALRLNADERAQAERNLVPLPLRGQSVALVSGENRDVRPTDVHAEFMERLSANEHRLVILDPLARFCPDIESNNAAATAGVEAFEGLSECPGQPAVIVCHHSNKESRKMGSKGGPGMTRGVTALYDGVRWEAQLLGEGEADLALRLSKGNYGPPDENTIPLERREGEGGFIRAIDPEDAVRARNSAEAGKLNEIKARMAAIIRQNPGQSKSALHRAIGGNRGTNFAAIEAMEREGLVEVREGRGRSLCVFVKEAA